MYYILDDDPETDHSNVTPDDGHLHQGGLVRLIEKADPIVQAPRGKRPWIRRAQD